MRLVSQAPVRRGIEKPRCIERIGAETVLRVGTERGVYGGFKIKRVIDKHVRARTGDMSRKGAVDDRGWPNPFPSVDTA